MSSPFESLLFGELRAADADGDYHKVGLVLNLGLDILERDHISDLAMTIPSETQDKIINSFANDDGDFLDVFFKFLWKTPIVSWGIEIPTDRSDIDLHRCFESVPILYSHIVNQGPILYSHIVNQGVYDRSWNLRPALLIIWSMAQWKMAPTEPALKDLYDFFRGLGRPRPEGMEGPYGRVGWIQAEDTLKKEIQNATRYFGLY